jgi:SAM-dependent methyltransferase
VQVEEYGKLRDQEDSYWWFVARRELAIGLVKSHACPGPILDMGCGTGAVLVELQALAPAVGLDVSPVALKFCRERGLDGLVAGDAQSLPFQPSTFSAVVALDVIEHVADDAAAVREAARALRPRGVLVINVPAFRSLWGPHDVALHHHRRYRAGEVRRLVEEAGLQVVKLSYGVFLLFPLVLLVRLVEKTRRGEAQVRLPRVPAWINRLLIGLQRLESKLMSWISLPWGSSIVVVASKEEEVDK